MIFKHNSYNFFLLYFKLINSQKPVSFAWLVKLFCAQAANKNLEWIQTFILWSIFARLSFRQFLQLNMDSEKINKLIESVPANRRIGDESTCILLHEHIHLIINRTVQIKNLTHMIIFSIYIYEWQNTCFLKSISSISLNVSLRMLVMSRCQE